MGQGQVLDAHYLGYFACFNRGWFYEAHDVLEELWLANRTGPNYAFYKGLIQLAGAFVHLQKIFRFRMVANIFSYYNEGAVRSHDPVPRHRQPQIS